MFCFVFQPLFKKKAGVVKRGNHYVDAACKEREPEKT